MAGREEEFELVLEEQIKFCQAAGEGMVFLKEEMI